MQAAVIGGKHHERRICQPVPVECGENLAHCRIQPLHNGGIEGIEGGAVGVDQPLRCCQGYVRAVEADREQEWLRRVGRLVGVDEIDRRLGMAKLPLAPLRRFGPGTCAPGSCRVKASGERPLPRITQMPFSYEDTPVSEGF